MADNGNIHDFEEQLVASLLMEQLPDIVVIQQLHIVDRRADGAAVWEAKVLLAGSGASLERREVQVAVRPDGTAEVVEP